MIKMIVRRFLAIIQIIVRVFKRALCCFRRRRPSFSEPDSPLTGINVISNQNVAEQSWNDWGDSSMKETRLSATEQQILQYRKDKFNPTPADLEPEVNFFAEMTPRIVKQKKLLLPSTKVEETNHSFALAPDPAFSSAELGVWEENTSWEADGDVDVSAVVREQKRQERERRLYEQQRKKMESRHTSS